MNRQTSIPDGAEQWLINLIELKNRVGMSCKQIAEEGKLAEKSVCNVFLGKVTNPGVILMRRIIHVLGGRLEDIFEESNVVIGGRELDTLQAEVDRLTELAESQRAKIDTLETENKILSVKLEYSEKLLAVHNYYTVSRETN